MWLSRLLPGQQCRTFVPLAKLPNPDYPLVRPPGAALPERGTPAEISRPSVNRWQKRSKKPCPIARRGSGKPRRFYAGSFGSKTGGTDAGILADWGLRWSMMCRIVTLLVSVGWCTPRKEPADFFFT